MEEKLEIAHFTDPLCFWCYAMEPEVRKIRVLLDEQLDYRIVMGVLSSDVRELVGNDAESEARYELYRAMLANHLRDAARAVGMPFAVDDLFTGEAEDLISLPLSLAYCAMLMVDDTFAEAYLRRMRECVFAEGRSLASIDAQVDLAAEFPIDIEQFRTILETDAAAPALQEGVDECRTYNVMAFPSLLMQYGDNRLMVRGYHSYPELREAISQVSDGEISLTDAEFSLHALEAYVDRFGKVAAREIQTMFSLNEAQLANVMMDLVTTGRYKTQNCGTSYFVVPK